MVHWDGKIIPDKFAFKKVDRLPILVSFENDVKIIDVPFLENQTALTIANAVYRAVSSWGLIDAVQGVCADTTNANLGLRVGAAAIFEQILNRDILYLPCRHHIYELVLSAAFTAKIPGTSGPNNQIFLKFRNEWDNIKSLNPVIENALEYINSSLKPRIPNMVKFIKQYLEKTIS